MSNQIAELESEIVATGPIPNTPVGKILVVDDERELRNILVESLQKHGYEVMGCGSPNQALAALQERDFDLLLTDLMMPEMDGIALLKAALEIDPNIIAIVVTGQGTIQTAVDAMQLGAFDYVLKPFRLQNLMPVLTRALNTRQLRLENLQLRETVAIHELTQTISFTLDPQTVMSKLTEAALQQTQADEVSVLLPTTDGHEFYVAAARGEHCERLLGERIPFDRSIASWVARERTPVILNGEVKDDRFVALWPRPAIRSSVSVPMLVAGKLVGVLNLNIVNRQRPFSLGQMKALSILAGTAAAGLESASLYTQLRTTEEKYRSIVDNAAEGLFQTTYDGHLLTANPAFARIFGYDSVEEMLVTVTDIATQIYVNPEDRSEAARLQEERGSLESFEFEAYRKNGEKIWLSLNRRSVRNHGTDMVFLEGSVEDITARRRIEEETRKAKQQYESLVHTIDGIVWELDIETFNFTFVSKQSERILGYTPAQWLADPNFWSDHLHPDDRSWALDFCLEAAGKNADHELDYRMIAADGRVVWLRDFVTVDGTNPNGTHLSGIMVDITERRLADEQIKKSEERYRLLFESNPQPMWVYDQETLAFLAVNKSAVHHYGYSREEFLGMTIKDIRPEAEVPNLVESLAIDSGGIDAAGTWRHRKKDGAIIEVEITAHSLVFDGRHAELILANDITEQKRLEAALLFSEEQLRQSQKLEAIGQLAGGVAHDFNNLLTVIGGYSSILLNKMDRDSPLRVSVEEIKKASDRAGGLTRQLLAFSRKQILQPKMLDLNAVVADLDKMVRRLIGEDIDLLTITDPKLGNVRADPGQIEQVLLNLIVNARDAMPDGGKLTIETANANLSSDYALRHAAVGGPYVMLAVSDTGCGMDAQLQQHVFEPFFTTKVPGKGTGLGLATVYGIVKQSDGHIWLYSEPGEGTCFKIYLPCVDEIVGASVTADGPPLVPKGTETLLLVEDDEQVRLIVQAILKEQGYHVLTAANGEEALNLAKLPGPAIHLLMTDVVMPQMSGRQLAEQLTAIRPQLKVLFMSGYTDDAIVRHGLLDASLSFIQKPFDAASAARKVREVLDS